jgi:hypothetical protein
VPWLTPVILATGEAERGKIAVPGQTGQKNVWETASEQENQAWWCVPVIPMTAGRIN